MATGNLTNYRPVEGFPGYTVGDDGSVWSRRGRWGHRRPWKLRPDRAKWGHQRVTLYREDGTSEHRAVHRLVLEAFVGPCPPGMECRHFPDRNPGNNRLDNLQWGSHADNLGPDKDAHGTQLRGERVHNAKLTRAAVLDIRASSEPLAVLAARYGVSQSQVSAVRKRKVWTHV